MSAAQQLVFASQSALQRSGIFSKDPLVFRMEPGVLNKTPQGLQRYEPGRRCILAANICRRMTVFVNKKFIVGANVVTSRL